MYFGMHPRDVDRLTVAEFDGFCAHAVELSKLDTRFRGGDGG